MIFSFRSSALIIFTERGNSSVNSLNDGPGERELYARNLQQLGLREAGLRKILVRLFADPFLAEQAKMNRGGKCVESFVGANVGSGLLAADVLFARSEGEHKPAMAFRITGLACEAAGHLADKFVARGDDANEWAAVARWNAECLAFHRDDVRIRRRLYDTER